MKLSHPCWKFDNKQRVLKCKAYCDDCLDKVTLSSRLESARLHLACVANGKSRLLHGPINYRFANAREGRLARENVTLDNWNVKFPCATLLLRAFECILLALSLLLGADYMRRAGPLSRAGSVCRVLGMSVKRTKNQLRDYMEKFQPG